MTDKAIKKYRIMNKDDDDDDDDTFIKVSKL